jgi:hypothetical protein
MNITTKMWSNSQAKIATLEKNVLALSNIIRYLYPRAMTTVADPVTTETEAQFALLVAGLPK